MDKDLKDAMQELVDANKYMIYTIGVGLEDVIVTLVLSHIVLRKSVYAIANMAIETLKSGNIL